MKPRDTITVEGPEYYPNGQRYFWVSCGSASLGSFTGSVGAWTPSGCRNPSASIRECVMRILKSRVKQSQQELRHNEELLAQWKNREK